MQLQRLRSVKPRFNFIFYNFICHFSKLGPHSQLKFTSWAPPTMLLERNFFGSRALGRQPLIPSIGRLGHFLVFQVGWFINQVKSQAGSIFKSIGRIGHFLSQYNRQARLFFSQYVDWVSRWAWSFCLTIIVIVTDIINIIVIVSITKPCIEWL